MDARTATGCLLLAALLLGACACPDYRAWRGSPPAPEAAEIEALPLPAPEDPELANLPHLPLLRLRGNGYQRGFQYGRAFPAEWRRATDELERRAVAYVREVVPPKVLARLVVRQYTAHLAQRFGGGSEACMPPEHRAYVQGIADGAGIDASRLLRSMAIVMLSDASCSAFVAFGPATEDGRLLQMRNLDWGGPELPASEATVLLLHEPPTGQRWLSIGVVGLVGSLSGINESGISLSEIGAGSSDTTSRGMPMPILLERVLAEAHDLDEALDIMRRAPGTGGYNYMIGSARERRGAAVEKTATRTAVFEVGVARYEDNPFFEGFAGFDCRADTAADPGVRAVQEASGGPGSPVGRGAYERRYRKQLELFESYGRVLDLKRAERLALEVAPRNNLHSILYDFERARVYVRNQAFFADRTREVTREMEMRTRAAAQQPAVLDLTRLFRGPGPAAARDEGSPLVRPTTPDAVPAAGLPPPRVLCPSATQR